MVPLLIEKLPHYPTEEPPAYQTPGASGMDLRAAGNLILPRGGRALVPCGFRMALPAGYEAQIRPRSGLALKHGITCLNSPGTIDSDYRGEVQVLLANFGEADFEVKRGERIAQMVVAKSERAAWDCVATLPESRRGEGGFGHTGQR